MLTTSEAVESAANSCSDEERLFFHFHPRPAADMVDELVTGLQQTPPTIAPKYFYDSVGAQLFDQITQLPEYYPTRTERGIYRRYADEITAAVGTGRVLIEPGSGSSEKVQLLLDSLRPSAYVPMEIAQSHLLAAANQLVERYPWLTVHAVCADYSDGIELPTSVPDEPRLVFFPGSTIGNFEPADAQCFLTQLRDVCADDGTLLIGVDLIKDKNTLEAAYNDNQDVTAEFNLNVLAHVNRVADATFDTDNFRHVAFYNSHEHRIEMHLQSTCEQTVLVDKKPITFAGGECIHTENSYKYTVDGFRELAGAAGFEPAKTWCDAKHLFSVHLFRAA